MSVSRTNSPKPVLPPPRPPQTGGACVFAKRWQLTSLLGEGQSTRVFRARPFDRGDAWPSDYVIKRGCTGADAEVVEFLLRNEADACRSVSDSHLPPLLESHWEAESYLVFPFLSGGSLAQRLQRWGAAPPAQAFAIIRQVLSALESLHTSGWTHGDVKPANIIVNSDGHATLIDLGFANHWKLAPSRREPIMATPGYAAPELQTGQVASPSSDMYSLGVTAFELLTSARPFNAPDAASLAEEHRYAPPPDVRKLAPHLGDQCARLVKRLLAKDPAERPTIKRVQQVLLKLEVDWFGRRAG